MSVDNDQLNQEIAAETVANDPAETEIARVWEWRKQLAADAPIPDGWPGGVEPLAGYVTHLQHLDRLSEARRAAEAAASVTPEPDDDVADEPEAPPAKRGGTSVDIDPPRPTTTLIHQLLLERN